MNYLDMTIKELHEALVQKKVTPLELVKEALKRAHEDDNNAFETIMDDYALNMASMLKEPEAENLFWGIPFVIKDNISTKGVLTTASSNILKDYVPLFDATVVTKLLEKKAIPIAKSTLDELAMGGTGTTGHLGKTYNPYDKSHTRMVGGSSCGSAASVAASIVPFALGSDTGDSVRKPASLAGLVGMKPTWGRISRFGLFPFAPSLDHIGYFTRSVFDSAALLSALSGRDDNDSTSSTRPVEDYTRLLDTPIEGKKIAVIDEIISSLTNEEIVRKFNETLDILKNKGAIIVHEHIPTRILETLYPTYMVISCAEVTSNNANLDGIKFGPRFGGNTYQEVMRAARTEGFGELIKRRFVIGSFALMRENQEELFLRAQKNRHLIVDIVNDILSRNDVIYVPAAPTVAPKFSDVSDKLSEEYLIADNHLVLGNFAGLPSITIPVGFIDNLPFGANFMGKAFNEAEVFQIAKALENELGYYNISAKKVTL